jgi:hypothetical protein
MMLPWTKAESDVNVADSEDAVDVLLRVAANARTFRSADGRFHAQVPLGDRHEIYALRSTAFRDWLIDSYLDDRGELPSAQAVGRVIAALEARARFDDAMPSVYVRVGSEGEADGADIYLDLGDPSGQAVKLSAQEWSIVDRPPVHFRRPEGMLPLPKPRRDGSIELLRPYVNLSELEFRLLIGWMAAALLPDGPYPILALHGEQGSAKTTLARVIRKLIDPQESPVLAVPRSTRDLMVTAFCGWLLVYDNISVVPNWLSDSLCRLSTGGGFAGRALFSNDERKVIHAQRPVVLNGIDEFVRREDLADRCMFLHLPPIVAGGRRAEVDFWRSFQADHAAIFGGLLNAMVGGLRALPSVRLAELPRMADFARFGEAVGRGLGWPANSFISAYSDNRWEATLGALEESALATVLLEWAEFGGLQNWTSSASEMLPRIAKDVDPRVRGSARWPKTPRTFSNELRRIAPQLRARGISVKFTRSRHSRLITIHADPGFDDCEAPLDSEERSDLD